MYSLRVMKPGSIAPLETVELDRAADVLTCIPELLARHAGCERIEVLASTTRLFAVDCHGQRLED